MDAPVDVVGRVGSILRAVAALEPDGGTTSEIARRTTLPRPSVHRLLAALEADGLVDRADGGRWRLGPELYILGTVASSRYDVSAVAQPVVRQLALATGESAFFSARRGNETVCLLREEGSFPIRSHVLYEGIRFPLGIASAGIAILAYLPDKDIESYLAGAGLGETHGPAYDHTLVWERVESTRRTGFALNPGLVVEGSWGMGAAVFDAEGSPRWALSLTGIEARFGPARRSELGAILLRAAHQLTLRLGGRSR